MITGAAKMVHTHASTADASAVARVCTAINVAATNSRAMPAQIVADTLRDVPVQIRAAASKRDSIKRSIHRHQSANLPKYPVTLREFIIKGEWATTVGA